MKTISNGDQLFGSRGITLAKAAGLLALAAILAGCPAPKTSDKVVVRGSNTIGEELAPKLIAEFKKEIPGVDFDLESKGTGYGLGNLLVGACDIAAASRGTNDFEARQTQSRGVELNDYIIGAYSVEVVVNAANTVDNLTREQVRDIFTGTIQNWKDVGGSDAPIHLYIRDPISGTHLGFREVAMENKPYGVFSDTFTNYAGIVEAVAKDVNGIGYSGFVAKKNSGSKVVSIGGVAPTVESVHGGQYPYGRVLRLYTNKAKESPATRSFIDFIESPKGQGILVQMGYVPRS